MDQAEQDLIKLVEWLLAITEHSVSPDAYALMLKATNSGVLHIYKHSEGPHEAQIVDLATAVSIICPRRRSPARYGLFFLREALVFREEDYAAPILTSSPQPTLQVLIDTLYAASQSYSSRYMAPQQGSFAAYQAYYSNLTYAELRADVTALPDITALNRITALFDRLIELSCEDAAVSSEDRYRAAALSGAIEDQIRRQQQPEVVHRFDLATWTSFDYLSTYALYQDMAERIKSGEFSETRGNRQA